MRRRLLVVAQGFIGVYKLYRTFTGVCRVYGVYGVCRVYSQFIVFRVYRFQGLGLGV